MSAIMKICLVLLAMVELNGIAQVKDIGTPFIRNFSKLDYKAGSQNWGIEQDLNGFMYFANNEGLLTYDGVRWELYRMPNLSMARSVIVDPKGEIYVGAYNDFGKMVPGIDGNLRFESLKESVPADYQNFDDVWKVLSNGDDILFQSYNAVYIYNYDNSVRVVEAPSRFTASFNVFGRIILFDNAEGLAELVNDTLVSLPGCESLKGEEISSVLPVSGENSLLISTINRGLFLYDWKELQRWDAPVNDILEESQVFSATVLQENYFAFGTIQDGIIIADRKGNLIQHINRQMGLQNNTILNIFSDRHGNLWLGLDNGIDYLTVNSPVTFLKNPDGFGAGYAELIAGDKLYLGTNQGLYVSDWNDGNPGESYRMVPGTSGQVWYLGSHRGRIVCGHNYGTFLIEGETARLIDNTPGGWKYHILKRYPDYMLGGTFSGLILFKWEEDTWTFVREIPGFSESFRIFEEDEEGELWMSHGFKGIFRVRLSQQLDSVMNWKFYSSEDGLPNNYSLNVFKIKGKLVFSSESAGIYEYDPQTDRFKYSAYFNQLFSSLKGFTYLKEDSSGNIWHVRDNRLGVYRIQEDFSFQLVTEPFTFLTGNFKHGFESIYPHSDNHVLIGIEDGFAHYTPKIGPWRYPDFATYITRVMQLDIDSTIFYGTRAPRFYGSSSVYRIPYKNNRLYFSFTTPLYEDPGNIEYSFMLSGFEESWSKWSNNTSQEFSHLHEGRYMFMVKARNQQGLESLADTFEFIVLKPWYKSTSSMIVYIILLSLITLLMVRFVNSRIEISRRKERLKQLKLYQDKEKEYRRQALLAEKEIIRVKNEKLEGEMIQRDKELANQAMSIIRKNDFLMTLKEEMSGLRQGQPDKNVSSRLALLIGRINREVGNNREREVFNEAFDEVHQAFINNLKSMYPSLTPTELRVCAFLKMNIASKEIAPLLNISVRGVETCRYRIRRKLGLDRSENLTSYLLSL